MAWTALKAAIAAVIKTNGNQEITGAVLQSILNTIVSNLGENATYKGIATPTTVPGTPDGNLFYIATEKGIYTNFDAITVNESDGMAILLYSNEWTKINIPIATKNDVIQLGEDLNELITALEQEQIQGGVYNVSSHNDGAVFESLSVLLGSANLSTLIPTSVRRGGMSIRFIQGSVPNSDNKYVQYFLTKDEWSTSKADWEKMNLEEEVSQLGQKVTDGSIFFKDNIPDANKRMTELYLVGLNSSKRYYFQLLGQYYDGNNYAEVHVALYSFTQDDKSDRQYVCKYLKTGTAPMSQKGIVKLTEYNSSGVYGWAIINISEDVFDDVTPEINIDVCSDIYNSPILSGISPATESGVVKTTNGNLIAEINGVKLYSGGIEFISFLDAGNSRVKELYISGNINAAHTYRLLTFSSGNYVGVNLYDYTDNDKLVAIGYKNLHHYEGFIELREKNSSGIVAYAFVNIGDDATQIYGVVNLDFATDLDVCPVIKNILGENFEDFYKYRKADITVSLYAANKYIKLTDGSLNDDNTLSVIKISGNDLLNKLTLLNIYTQGEDICGIGAYKSDGSFIRNIFTLPFTPLGKYNYYVDLTTQDLSLVDYLLLTVDTNHQDLGEILCLVEQFDRSDFYFYSENNGPQEIKENHIYLKADGTTPKLSETLLGITDSGYYNRYIIHLENGEYDIMDGISHIEDPTTNPYGDGVWVKDYVSIIGDSEVENTVIKCELDPSVDTQTTTQDGYTISIMEKISTINASSNSSIENVTITAKNCRYAIHSDYSHYPMEDTELSFKNCKVIHYGDTAGWPIPRQVSRPSCYGGGIRNGQKRIFNNCEFVAYQNVPWFTHNAITMDKDAFIELVGCSVINLTENITPTSSEFPGIVLISYGVTANVHTKIVGCIVGNGIVLREYTLNGHTTKGTDYVVEGHGNIVPVKYEEKEGTTVPRNNYCVKFSDEGIVALNGANTIIPLGTPVRMNDNGLIIPLNVGEEEMFLGFVNEDVGVGASGYVKTRRYYSLEDLGIAVANWAVGTKFKLQGNQFVQDNAGTFVVKRYGYIEL